MIMMRVENCDVSILPIIKGLISESEKVKEALKKDYEAIAVALGIEEIEVLRRRKEIIGENETSDLDSVYGFLLKDYGNIDMPVPAYTELIDTCSERNISVIPLDMDDETYTKIYCDTVTPWELYKEKRIMKKAMKTKFGETPEEFVKKWDSIVNEIKGYKKMSLIREEYIANQIKDTAKYRKNLLVIIEYERVDGVIELIGDE
ncbi:MAG: hypothetical protein WC248_00230 [Candidatus Methanomethylophilaceae archaeon]